MAGGAFVMGKNVLPGITNKFMIALSDTQCVLLKSVPQNSRACMYASILQILKETSPVTG